MPKKAVSHEQDYAVDSGTIRLTVIVGDRQYGSSLVFLDDELVANGDIDEIPIGKGDDLVGRTLTVYTVVTDIRDRKTEVSVRWVLTGGRGNLKVGKDGSAGKRFGSQMFKAVFHFTGQD